MTHVYSGKKSDEMLDYLLKRRSAKAAEMRAPGPDRAQMDDILRAAARVPDHGRTVPFYFLVFEGEGRRKAAALVTQAYRHNHPQAKAEEAAEAGEKFMQAPAMVAVIYRARGGKHPLWEQMMSVGAACQNLILAANASGFAAQWLSRWYAYDETVRSGLGLDERDVVAGFIHIGTPPERTEDERERPDLAAIVTYWDDAATVRKGDAEYGRDKFALPDLGFSIRS